LGYEICGHLVVALQLCAEHGIGVTCCDVHIAD